MNQNTLQKICFKIIILVSLLVSVSCKKDKENKTSDSNESTENLPKLVEEESITFPLDKETNYNFYVKPYATDNNTYLSFYNYSNNSIYIYDYNSKSLKKRVQLEKEGPNGIKLGGRLAPSYFIHTLDSIFLTGYINQYLINGDGEILLKGSINNNDSDLMTQKDYVLTFDKATYFNNGSIYSGITSYSKNDEVSDLRVLIPLPFDSITETYLKKDILIPNYDEVSKIKAELLNEGRRVVMGLTFARNGDYLYASTPISDTVSIFKNEKLINKVYTDTDDIKVTDTQGYFDQFRTKTYLKAMEYAFYKGLFSDVTNDRNFLYRVVSKGNNVVYNEDTKQDEQQSKGAYLIIIDLDTNKSTYLDLPADDIDLNSCIVANGKIHFKLKVQENENEMTFKTFSIE